jgi:uncharacterized protein (TIGR02594 family)
VSELIQYPIWADYAFRELLLDVRETPGPESNARVLQYFMATDLKPFDGDETSWCAAGANFVLMMGVIQGTGKANARSFCDWGREVGFRRGAIQVLWRESRSSWKGHVGIQVGWSGTHTYLLGGNQGNAWSVRPYLIDRVLTTRWATTDMLYA